MEVLLIATVGTLCIVCFFIGAKVGQKASKGEEITVPTINPIKAIQEHQNKKAAEKEQSKIETIMQNIEKYDGTSRGQEDVG